MDNLAPTARKTLDALRSGPGTALELAQHTSRSRSAIDKALADLAAAGLVAKIDGSRADGAPTRWQLTSAGPADEPTDQVTDRATDQVANEPAEEPVDEPAEAVPGGEPRPQPAADSTSPGSTSPGGDATATILPATVPTAHDVRTDNPTHELADEPAGPASDASAQSPSAGATAAPATAVGTEPGTRPAPTGTAEKNGTASPTVDKPLTDGEPADTPTATTLPAETPAEDDPAEDDAAEDDPAAAGPPKRCRGCQTQLPPMCPACWQKTPAYCADCRKTMPQARHGQPTEPLTLTNGLRKLRRGELEALVAAVIRTHPLPGHLGITGWTSGRVAVFLPGRSSGAIGNALRKLASTGDAELIGEHPERYRPTAGTAAEPDGANRADANEDTEHHPTAPAAAPNADASRPTP